VMMEVIRSSETEVLTRVTSQKTSFLIVMVVKNSNLATIKTSLQTVTRSHLRKEACCIVNWKLYELCVIEQLCRRM
jgi:hypothetical protein